LPLEYILAEVVPPAGDWSKVRFNFRSNIGAGIHPGGSGSSCRRLVKGTVSISVPPLAQEYILAEVVPPAGDWSKVSYQDYYLSCGSGFIRFHDLDPDSVGPVI
jgi:hypothetical protein